MKVRPIRIEGDLAFVTLTRGYIAKIDTADCHLIDGRNWTAQVHPARHGVYAMCNMSIDGTRKTTFMHRIIMSAEWPYQVDHINGDTLDNRRCNLRLATFGQNQRNRVKYANNSSGYKGVSWDKTHEVWKANVRVNGRRISIGTFRDKQEAVAAYNKAAQIIHGRFANVDGGDPVKYSHGVLWRALADILEIGLDETNEIQRRIIEIAEEALWHDTYSDFKPEPRVYRFGK